MAPEYTKPTYVVTGLVNGDGKILGGTGGFTVERVDEGVYTVLFIPTFLVTPVVVATQVYPNELSSKGFDTRDNAVVVGADNTRVRIRTGNHEGRPKDRTFTFNATGMGPGLLAEEASD
ncbi:hypothetical protein Caci_2748 [Catenulispora acidiphila DSM 44928]|uniref:Uncharacterized protein n=1 Tax=Catenulispora acidiphila (strain DSM 44928 / JCM 14897 / NBRC 102108 / NRRL B-24433 / ID139908) TaxID=479433 RepID=C7Q0Y6_CATAD|nr:hypothetical protein [Catenulispora acidiphila]ACU71661.1 hypothetical protein Caci_2748 [Catenulispora acidiphila DSM 44928]